jgi:hypothetical protein
MEEILNKIILQGEKGIKLKNVTKSFFFFFDLKCIYQIINFLKTNILSFKFSTSFFLGNTIITCIGEEFRKKFFECLFQNYINNNEIIFQILKEIGKKDLKGISQQYLIKKLKLKTKYFHHVFTKLFKLGIIRKTITKIKKNYKIFYSPILSINFFSLNKNFQKLNFKNFKINPEKKELNLIKNIIKIGIRQDKKIFFEKDLKYGILFLNFFPKKFNRKKIHRLWQKIRERCRKAKIFNIKSHRKKCEILFTYFKNQFYFTKKKNFNSFKILRKKKNLCEIYFFFLFSFSILLQKTIKHNNKSGVNSIFLIVKFRGQLGYKNISGILNNFFKFRGYKKILEQIGRQKILIFKQNNINFTKKSKNFFKSEKYALVKKVTKQIIDRRLNLLSWIKNDYILLKNLGKKIAFHENKGLKRVDSKVVKRIVSDLINFKLLRILKIYVQINLKHAKKFEFIVEYSFRKNQIENIFSFFLSPIKFFSKKQTKNFKKKKVFSISTKNINLFNIFLFFLRGNILLTHFLKKNTTSNFKKKVPGNFFYKEILWGKNLNLFRNLFWQNFFFLYLLSKRKKIFKSKKKKIEFRKWNLCDLSSCTLLNKLKKIIKFYIFITLTCKKNWKIKNFNKKKIKKLEFYYFSLSKKKKIVVKKKLKNSFLNKLFFIYNFKKTFNVQTSFLYYRKKKNFKEKEQITKFEIFIFDIIKNEKWDSELDINIYLYFLFLLQYKKLNQFSNFFWRNFKFFKRRIKKISVISNVKIVTLIFKKFTLYTNSFFLKTELWNFRNFIKRSLEFPASYFFFVVDKLKKNVLFFKKKKFIIFKDQKNLKKDEKYNFFEKIRFYFLKIFFFKLKFVNRNIFYLYTSCFLKIFYSFFIREILVFFDFLDKKENSINYENLLSFQFFFSLREVGKHIVFYSENLNIPLNFKIFEFYQKLDNEIITLVPFFVKKFFFSNIFFFYLLKRNLIYFKKFSQKFVLNPLEIRIFSFSSTYLSKERFEKIEHKHKKKKIKSELINYSFISTKIKNLKKKNNFFNNISKKKIFEIFSLFSKNKFKNYYSIVWTFFFNFKNIFIFNNYKFFLSDKFNEAWFSMKNIKINKKAKYLIFSEVIKKVFFRKEFFFFLFKKFPNVISLLNKNLKILSLENRIQSKKLNIKTIYSKPVFFLSNFDSQYQLFFEYKSCLFFIPKFF